ncbi:MAG: hypothetical protein JST00_44440 [Deltaproteobacteria bacterium]|nr:hypothetical protein [Deltaproteobacteria bacterium]
MKTTIPAIAFLLSAGLLATFVGCDDKKPEGSSGTPSASVSASAAPATASASASAAPSASASAAPAAADDDDKAAEVEEDFEDEASTTITEKNFEAELDKLEKEIAKP